MPVTTEVGADATWADPATFEPVTTIRTSEPTSARVSEYPLEWAPVMSAQLFPLASQRCH